MMEGQVMTWQIRSGTQSREAPVSGTSSAWSAVCRALVAAAALASMGLAADKKTRKADAPAAKAATGSSLVDELKSAFDEGFVFGGSHLKESEKHLALAKKLAPAGDWRIDYATGLVYLKQSQMKPAIARFEAAARSEGPAGWRAWQALIWSRFVARENDEGFKDLDEFAAVVKKAGPSDGTSPEQRDAARWMGQLLESLVRCNESKKFREQVSDHEARLTEALGSELSEAVESGREFIRDREIELGREAEAASAEAAQSKKRRKQEEADSIAKKTTGIKETKENNAKSAEDWKKFLDETLEKTEKQLTKLETDYQDLDRQAATHMEAYNRSGQLFTRYLIAAPPGTNMLDLRNEMESYRAQYNATIARMSAVLAQATQIVEQRTQVTADYQKATGDIVKENAKLDKWSARLKDQKQKLEDDQPAGKVAKGAKAAKAKPAKPAPADKKQQFTLKTFLPLDLERERDRLLESYAASKSGGEVEESHSGK
jgi:hypothetical protein